MKSAGVSVSHARVKNALAAAERTLAWPPLRRLAMQPIAGHREASADALGDMSDDGRWLTTTSRWLTYDELAKIRGISRPSAERLVQHVT